MKSENDFNDSLHGVLQQWKVTDSLPPRFADRVWQRIEREESAKPAGAWAFFLSLMEELRRPAMASTYVALLLLLGVGAGYWHARMDNERASQELGARYVHLMDPYQR